MYLKINRIGKSNIYNVLLDGEKIGEVVNKKTYHPKYYKQVLMADAENLARKIERLDNLRYLHIEFNNN